MPTSKWAGQTGDLVGRSSAGWSVGRSDGWVGWRRCTSSPPKLKLSVWWRFEHKCAMRRVAFCDVIALGGAEAVEPCTTTSRYCASAHAGRFQVVSMIVVLLAMTTCRHRRQNAHICVPQLKLPTVKVRMGGVVHAPQCLNTLAYKCQTYAGETHSSKSRDCSLLRTQPQLKGHIASFASTIPHPTFHSVLNVKSMLDFTRFWAFDKIWMIRMMSKRAGFYPNATYQYFKQI